MRVIYNGIDLMPVETLSINLEPVYDETGIDYLFSRLTASFRAIVAGEAFITYTFDDLVNTTLSTDYTPPSIYRPATSTISASDPVKVDTTIAGDVGRTIHPRLGIDAKYPSSNKRIPIYHRNAATLTHQVVRHRLQTPRGKLFIFSGPGIDSVPESDYTDKPVPWITGLKGAEKAFTLSPASGIPVTVLVESPEGQNLCDAKKGPLPNLLSIVGAEGDANLFFIEFSIETYLNEADLNEIDNYGILLSNRFVQNHSIDEHGYTRIITHGTAVYRSDWVYQYRMNPDKDRPVLFMPIPFGFKRHVDYVREIPNVDGVEYMYTDYQVPVHFAAGPYVGAADIEVEHRQAMIKDSSLMSELLRLFGKKKKKSRKKKNP
jgi:hypothetical protein